MMMMTPVFFVIGVPRQSHPTQDWEEQADTCSTEDRYDADEYGNRHAEEHPNKAHLVVAFVDVT